MPTLAVSGTAARPDAGDNFVRDMPVRDMPVRDMPVRDMPVRDVPVREMLVRSSPVRAALARRSARFAPFAGVVVLHLLVIYAAYSGLLTRMVQVAMPAAVYVTFVADTPAKTEATPPPKTVQITQMPPPLFHPPVVPIVLATPVERSITVAPAVAAPEQHSSAAPVTAAVVTPAAAPVAGPKTITSGVEYVHAPQPIYPPMAKRMGEQGKVVLRILVNERGVPDQVTVQTSSGSARLDEAGRQAALRALFKPHLEDGRAIAVYVIVPLNFQLAS